MSGGSWDYFYSHLEQAADRLICEKSPLRRAFGHHLARCAKALHDIEWVDSGDYGDGAERKAIQAVLEDTATEKTFDEIFSEIVKMRDGLSELLENRQPRQPAERKEHTP